MKTIFIIMIFLLAQSFVTAQSVIWRQIIGEEYNEVGRDVIELSDHGYLMVGEKQVLQNGTMNVIYQSYLVKLDRFGTIVWQKIIGDTVYGNYAYAVTEDPSGNIYLPCNSSNPHLVKMNSSGTILWDKNYSINSIKLFGGISFVDNYKNIVILGLNEISDYLTSSLSKLDSSGNLIWTKAYYDSIPSISAYSSYSNCYLVTDNSYFLCGNKGVNGFIIKTDTSGNRIWTKRYTQSQYIMSIVKNSENTFIATGGPRDSNTICIKFDQNGDTIWTKKYGSGGFGWNKIVKTYSSNYAIGTVEGDNFTRIGIIDSSGNILSVYNNLYPENVLLSQRNLNSTSDSGIVLTGDIGIYPNGNNFQSARTDAIIFKVDKYGNMVSVKNINEFESENFEINTFPNPFNLSVNLRFNLTKSAKVIIELFDLSGKKINEIENTLLNSGKHIYLINTPELCSGVYFIKIKINNSVYSKKILLIK